MNIDPETGCTPEEMESADQLWEEERRAEQRMDWLEQLAEMEFDD